MADINSAPNRRQRLFGFSLSRIFGQANDGHARRCESDSGTKVRTILGVPICVKTANEGVSLLDERFQRRSPTIVAFANAHSLNIAASDASFRAALRSCLVFNDGIGTDIASRILYGSSFPENLNGTDFKPRYLRQTAHQFSIFLLGSKPGDAE